MKYLTALHTDIGIRKDTNQDSMLLMHAESSYGDIIFAVICDGMGGLKKGEVASAQMIRVLKDWFAGQFPKLLSPSFDPNNLMTDWRRIIGEQADLIENYGNRNGYMLGTTLVAFLCLGDQYYIANVGDSRVYQIESNKLYLLTHDHTVVQREVDLGNMTMEQAAKDKRRSILLQCIGASDTVEPDFFSGTLKPGQVYLLCCDGFRHVIGTQEFIKSFNPHQMKDERKMQKALVDMTEEIKRRKETDNISAILIKTLG